MKEGIIALMIFLGIAAVSVGAMYCTGWLTITAVNMFKSIPVEITNTKCFVIGGTFSAIGGLFKSNK